MLIDRYLPHYDVTEVQECEVEADAASLHRHPSSHWSRRSQPRPVIGTGLVRRPELVALRQG